MPTVYEKVNLILHVILLLVIWINYHTEMVDYRNVIKQKLNFNKKIDIMMRFVDLTSSFYMLSHNKLILPA